jgi:protein O-GlcNAc transferase
MKMANNVRDEARTLAIPPEVNAVMNLFNQKRYAECETLARTLTARFPDQGFAWKVLGAVIKLQGRMTEALLPMQNAASLWPSDPEGHKNLGNLLYDLGRFTEAEASFRQAIFIQPDLAEAHNNLGNALREQDRLTEAEASCRQALAIKPNFAQAYRSLILALQDQGRAAEARTILQRALEIVPDDARLRLLQVMATLPIVPQSNAESIASPDEFDRALENIADWLAVAPAHQAQFSEAVGLEQPFYLAYRNGNHLGRLSRYGDIVAGSMAPVTIMSAPPQRKLRLAVVSQYFRSHSVWQVIVQGLLENLDRSRFEVVLYHTGHEEDGGTAHAMSLADIWRDHRTVGGLQGWLETIAADVPDVILYPEIAMDPMSLRLAVRRLAPLQVASWGHPITTGLPTIDLYFSGELLEPRDAETHYRERLVRLPGTGCCTASLVLAPEAIPELAATLTLRNEPLFLIAQRPMKFDPVDDALYADIATALGGGTFILSSDPKYPWATEQVVARLSRAFSERGLDPGRHLLVVPWLSRAQFCALLDQCDVYLDCPSFSGYTTARQAVNRGIPVVTLEGEYMRRRLAAGLLRKIGLTDTIASSAEEYVAIAVRLAAESRNPSRRDTRRHALKAAAPQADHDVGVVRAFEQHLISALAERRRQYRQYSLST